METKLFNRSFRFYFKTLILFVLFGMSCSKDQDDQESQPTSPNMKIDLFGVVTDQSGNGLQGVKVMAGAVVGFTDQSGFYVLKNVQVSDGRYYVSAELTGFISNGRGGRVSKNGVYIASIRIFEKGNPTQLNSSTGGQVNLGSGGTLSFTPNSFVTEAGLPYSGTVIVYKRLLKNDASDFELKVPGGDLTARNANNERTIFSPLSFVGILLEDQVGNKLKLTSGSTAAFHIPVASTQSISAPTTASLLWLDESTGEFIEDGIAVKNGDFYDGNVSHFTWWSAAVITNPPAPTISGQVLDCNGNPVPFAVVFADGFYSMVTDINGLYSNWIPQGQHSFHTYQNNVFGLLGSNIEYVNTTSGHYVIPDLFIPCSAVLNFQTEDCLSNPIPAFAGIRKISNNNGGSTSSSSLLIYSNNGTFSFMVPNNETLEITLSDGFTTVQDTFNVAATGTSFSAGTIAVCNAAVQSCPGGPSTVTDLDGNLYHVVSIGNQCWMQENLKVSKYSNGDTIGVAASPYLTNHPFPTYSYGTYADLSPQTAMIEPLFGKYYDTQAIVDARNLCPTGWHVPTVHEYRTLIKYLDPLADTISSNGLSSDYAGAMMTSTIMTYGTNSSGFTAMPSGFYGYGFLYWRLYDTPFLATSTFWNQTSLYGLELKFNSNGAGTTSRPAGDFWPVRCIQD